MTHFVRVATAFTLTLVAVSVGTARVAADSPSTELGAGPRAVVRIYDTAVGHETIRTAAIRAAAAILDDAGVALDLHDCTTAASSACRHADSTRDLIVRILPASVPAVRVPGRAPRPASGQAEAHANLEDANFQLGFAVVDPVTRSGAMATVFDDQVVSIARRTGVDHGELLGRTLAHEIGHLLFRNVGHSSAGLMRAVWTDAELTMNRREDWLFTATDRLRLLYPETGIAEETD